MLVLRQRDAGGVDAVVLGRPQQQARPSPSRCPGSARPALQHQLAADVVELGLLRLRQRHVGRRGSRRTNTRGADRATARRSRPRRRSGTRSAPRPCSANARRATWRAAAAGPTSRCRSRPDCRAAGRRPHRSGRASRLRSGRVPSTYASPIAPIWLAASLARPDQSEKASVTREPGLGNAPAVGQLQRDGHGKSVQARLDLRYQALHAEDSCDRVTAIVNRPRADRPCSPLT